MTAIPRLVWLAVVLVAGSAAGDGLRVDDAYVVEPPPGATVAAAYFSLTNHGDSRRVIVAVDGEPPASLSLHRSLEQGGIARMLPAGRIEVEIGQTVRFEPGGLHVMIHGADLAGATSYRFDLIAASGERVRVVAELRKRPRARNRDPSHAHSRTSGDSR
jgi:copper(I)-binding protein